MTINGGLAEITVTQVDDHRIAVKMGKHRVFDIVDGDAGQLAEHKVSGTGDTVFANPRDLVEKLNTLLNPGVQTA